MPLLFVMGRSGHFDSVVTRSLCGSKEAEDELSSPSRLDRMVARYLRPSFMCEFVYGRGCWGRKRGGSSRARNGHHNGLNDDCSETYEYVEEREPSNPDDTSLLLGSFDPPPCLSRSIDLDPD